MSCLTGGENSFDLVFVGFLSSYFEWKVKLVHVYKKDTGSKNC